jgi:hypothetical protein
MWPTGQQTQEPILFAAMFSGFVDAHVEVAE